MDERPRISTGTISAAPPSKPSRNGKRVGFATRSEYYASEAAPRLNITKTWGRKQAAALPAGFFFSFFALLFSGESSTRLAEHGILACFGILGSVAQIDHAGSHAGNRAGASQSLIPTSHNRSKTQFQAHNAKTSGLACSFRLRIHVIILLAVL